MYSVLEASVCWNWVCGKMHFMMQRWFWKGQNIQSFPRDWINYTILRNPSHVKAIFCKSEALYNMCNFEYALLGYLKGSRLVPDAEEFKLGHIKCKKTITNSLTNDVFDDISSSGSDLIHFLNTFRTTLQTYEGKIVFLKSK